MQAFSSASFSSFSSSYALSETSVSNQVAASVPHGKTPKVGCKHFATRWVTWKRRCEPGLEARALTVEAAELWTGIRRSEGKPHVERTRNLCKHVLFCCLHPCCGPSPRVLSRGWSFGHAPLPPNLSLFTFRASAHHGGPECFRPASFSRMTLASRSNAAVEGRSFS